MIALGCDLCLLTPRHSTLALPACPATPVGTAALHALQPMLAESTEPAGLCCCLAGGVGAERTGQRGRLRLHRAGFHLGNGRVWGWGGGDHGTHGCTSENAEALSVSRPPRLQKGSIEKAVCPLMGNWASADATAGRDKHTGRNSWEVLPREAKVPSHHPRSTCSPPPNGRGGAVSRFQLWHQHTTFAFPNHFRTAGLSGYVPNTP